MMGASLVVASTTAIFAAEAASDGWIDTLLRGGPFALILLLIMLDKLGPHGERDRLRGENRALQAAIDRQNEAIRKDLLPAILEANRLQAEVIRALDGLAARRPPPP